MPDKKTYVFDDIKQLNKWKVRAVAFNLKYLIFQEVNSGRYYVFIR